MYHYALCTMKKKNTTGMIAPKMAKISALCACVFAVYVRAVISESTRCAQALLLLVLQATLCSQDLAAG